MKFKRCEALAHGGKKMNYDILWNEDDLLELEALNEILNIK